MIIFRRYASVNYLVSSLPKAVEVPKTKAKISQESSVRALPSAKVSQYIYNARDLSGYFRENTCAQPSPAQITRANALFQEAKVTHEWTCARYDEIPDVKKMRLMKEREQYSAIEPRDRTEYQKSVINLRKSLGVNPLHLNPLPEVLLLGHTNAGKSTLVNTLLLNKHQSKAGNATTEYAYVSRRAGYTKCLNSYNIGKKLRLIDSPGYGQFGEHDQGQVVLDYIQKRKQLRRTFLVIDSTAGIRDEDTMLMDFLTENGASFEIIFTKVDELVLRKFPKINMKPNKHDSQARLESYERVKQGNSNVVQYFQGIIDKAGLRDLAASPRLIFNNSRANNILEKRQGFKDVRFAIAESCGLV